MFSCFGPRRASEPIVGSKTRGSELDPRLLESPTLTKSATTHSTDRLSESSANDLFEVKANELGTEHGPVDAEKSHIVKEVTVDAAASPRPFNDTSSEHALEVSTENRRPKLVVHTEPDGSVHLPPLVSTKAGDLSQEDLILLLLCQVCSFSDPTNKTFEAACETLKEKGVISKSAVGPIMQRMLAEPPAAVAAPKASPPRSSRARSYPNPQNRRGLTLSSSLESIRDILMTSSSRYRSDFVELGVIGRGSFGKVYKARHKIDNSCYAIKQITFANSGRSSLFEKKALREVTCLAKLDHPNICRYYNAWIEPVIPSLHSVTEQSHSRTRRRTRARSEMAPSPKSKTSLHMNTLLPSSLIGSQELELLTVTAGLGKSDSDGSLTDDETSEETFSFGSSFQRDVSEALAVSHSLDTIDTDDYSNTEEDEPTDNGEFHLPDELRLPYPTDILGGFEIKSVSSDGSPLSAQSNPLDGETHSFSSVEILPDTPFHNKNRRNTPIRPPKLKRATTGPTVRAEDDASFKQRRKFRLYIQTQLYEGYTLNTWLKSRRTQVHASVNMCIIFQLLCGLHHIHSRGIMHRDLKPSNIFVDPTSSPSHGVATPPIQAIFSPESSTSYTLKIGDFGLAKDYELHQLLHDSQDTPALKGKHHGKKRDMTNAGVGTVSYSSPEQISGQFYSTKSDIYSLGIIMFEMYQLFSTGMERAILLTNLRKGRLPPAFETEFPDEARLILSMTRIKPSKRPSASDLLMDSYVSQFSTRSPSHGFFSPPTSPMKVPVFALTTTPVRTHRANRPPGLQPLKLGAPALRPKAGGPQTVFAQAPANHTHLAVSKQQLAEQLQQANQELLDKEKQIQELQAKLASLQQNVV